MSSPAASASPALTPGTLISDDVEVLSRVALNGPVARYMARQLGRRGHVLVHVLSAPPPDDGPDMALRELEHASTVSHPNLAQSQGCGRSTPETLYVVEGYPPGELLDEALEEETGSVSTREAARRALCLLRALAAAHEAGSYHGMLSPADVLVERTDMSEPRVRLLGLGIVQALRSAGVQVAAADSAYVPIEARATDAQADLYAVAAMTLASVAGRTAVRALHADDGDATLPPAVVKGPLAGVLQRALHTDPEARYASAADFARALADVVDSLGPDSARRRDAADPNQDIVGFDASLSSIVGSAGPDIAADVSSASAGGDWLDLLPSTSSSGRHSALAALQAELAFSGADAESLGEVLHDDDRDSTRVSGPPVPEEVSEVTAAPDLAAATEDTASGAPSVPAALLEEIAAATPPPSSDTVDSDVTRLSPPPVGPEPREESTQVGRPAEHVATPVANAGVVEQRATDNAGGLRTDVTHVVTRPIVSDGALPPPPPVRTAPADGPPPGSAFELMVEPDDADAASADPLGSDVTALREPEPVEAVQVVVHEALLPSTIPVERLLARELEPFDDDLEDEPDEVTSPGRPRHLALASRVVDADAERPVATAAHREAAHEPARRRRSALVAALVVAAALGVVCALVLFDDRDDTSAAVTTGEGAEDPAPVTTPASTDEPAPEPPDEPDPVLAAPADPGQDNADDPSQATAAGTDDITDDITAPIESTAPVEPGADGDDTTPTGDDNASGADSQTTSTPEEEAAAAERRRERRERRRREREARERDDNASGDGGSILDLKVD